MSIKPILQAVNNLSIANKIAIGFLLMLVIFGSQSLFISTKLVNLSGSITRTSQLTTNSAAILNISKDISELQRTALVYGQSGSVSIIDKMQETYQGIKVNLTKIQKTTMNPESLRLLESMSKVVNRYGENIESLQDRYQSRDLLIAKKLPEIREQGTAFLQSIIAEAKQASDDESTILVQSILQEWLVANLDALSYLQNRQFSHKKNVYTKVKYIRVMNQQPTNNTLAKNNYNSSEFDRLITEFRETFDQSILANRNYLSLVNVVMAGEALEFTILSDKLRSHTLALLRDISLKSRSEVDESVSFINSVMIASIPLLILIITFFNMSITREIQRIARTFGKLVDGDFNQPIPGLNRRDEIGQLAHAADAFKKVSEKFKDAKLIAEKASQHKSEFLANMSHEIRTPMNGIIGTTQLMLETEMQPKQKTYAETTLSSAKSLLNIINDILDFSKIEAGKLELENIPFNMQALFQDATELMSLKAREKNLEILLRYKNGTPTHVMGDPGRVRQILINLISNAIKFTEKGYVLTTIELASNVSGRHRFHITIEDTGIGIALDKQTKIFNKFDQADGSTTRKYGGTGLGLSISQQLVNMMNGDIKITSVPGSGTTVSFSLELGVSEPLTAANDEDYTLLSGLKTLIIDDNEIAQNILLEQIIDLGLQTETCRCGTEGISKLHSAADQNVPFDVVIVDSQFADMSGKALIKCIKEDPSISDIVIIFLTSTPLRGEGKVLSKLGVDGYLTKPTYHSEVNKVLSIIWNARLQHKTISLTTQHVVREMKQSLSLKPVFMNTKILVAEDNPVNQMVAAELLHGYGCVVDMAENGKQALSMWKSNQYDLILMDCQMPIMDGFEAANSIRNNEKKNSKIAIPIIAFTANAMQGDKDKCLNAGMDDYISKPVIQHDLECILKKWLSDKLVEVVSSEKRMEDTYTHDYNVDNTPKTANTDIIELSVLNNLGKLFKDKFPEFLALHNRTLAENVRKAHQAVENNDCQALSAVMHSIKSSSRQFGALQLGEIAESIEKLALANKLEMAKKELKLFVVMQKAAIKSIQKHQEVFQYTEFRRSKNAHSE